MTNMCRTGTSKKINKKSKYYIGICELHNDLLHGFDENSSPDVKGHYLLMEKFNNFHKYIINDVYNSRYNEGRYIESDSDSLRFSTTFFGFLVVLVFFTVFFIAVSVSSSIF